jgi:hypothetical protein
MTYKVIASFTDLEDNKRLYEVGQSYPREGLEPSEDRFTALSSRNNIGKKPFIKFVEDKVAPKVEVPLEREVDEVEEFPKHTGGGYYELSNGEKVKGKGAAEKAEKALKSGE